MKLHLNHKLYRALRKAVCTLSIATSVTIASSSLFTAQASAAVSVSDNAASLGGDAGEYTFTQEADNSYKISVKDGAETTHATTDDLSIQLTPNVAPTGDMIVNLNGGDYGAVRIMSTNDATVIDMVDPVDITLNVTGDTKLTFGNADAQGLIGWNGQNNINLKLNTTINVATTSIESLGYIGLSGESNSGTTQTIRMDGTQTLNLKTGKFGAYTDSSTYGDGDSYSLFAGSKAVNVSGELVYNLGVASTAENQAAADAALVFDGHIIGGLVTQKTNHKGTVNATIDITLMSGTYQGIYGGGQTDGSTTQTGDFNMNYYGGIINGVIARTKGATLDGIATANIYGSLSSTALEEGGFEHINVLSNTKDGVAYAGNLTIATGETWTIGGDAYYDLTVGAGASLTVEGGLLFNEMLSGEGSLIFADSATIDLGSLTASASAGMLSYTLTTNGSVDFGDMDWADIAGLGGLNETTHRLFFDSNAIIFMSLATRLTYEGTGEGMPPSDLAWSNDAAAMDFLNGETKSAYQANSIVDFHGTTIAVLQEDIVADAIAIARNSYLNLSSSIEADYQLQVGTIELGSGATLDITASILDASAGATYISSSVHNSELNLDMSDVTDSAATLNLSGFGGELIITAGTLAESYASYEAHNSTRINAGATYELSGLGADGNLTGLTSKSGSQLVLHLADNNGTTVTMSESFSGAIAIASGVMSLPNTDLGGSAVTVMNGAGLIFDHSTTTSYAGAIQIADTASITIRSWEQNSADDVHSITGAITGAADTLITKTDAGTLSLNNLSGFVGSISVNDGKLIVDSDATFNTLTISNGKTFSVAAGKTVSTVGVTGAKSLYERDYDYGYTIEVGVGATFTDNAYMKLGNGTISIEGGGTYKAVGYMGTDDGYNRTSKLNIAENTTLVLTGEVTDGDSGVNSSFMLGHWGNGDSDVNISGTLDINSGLSSKDGSGDVNVKDGGTFIMRKGLYAVDANSNAGVLRINAESGSTVQLANQATATAAGVLVANFAAGSSIEAISETTNVLNAMNLTTAGAVNLKAVAGVTTVNMNGVISSTADVASGLAISGTADQTFNLNAVNSYTGGTSITGAKVVVNNVSAFGTGDIAMSSGTLDLSSQAVANSISAASGTLQGFSAYAGTLSVTGSVTATGSMAGTIDATAGTLLIDSAVDITGSITGHMDVSAMGSLTLSGSWDYSDSITNAGNITFGSDLMLNLLDTDFSQSGNSYTLTLFNGTADLGSWLNGSDVNTSKITGLTDMENKTFSYSNGVLSYTTSAPTDGHIGTDETKPFTGSMSAPITFEDSTGVAQLGSGFSQEAGTSFSGKGTIEVLAGSDLTFNQASASFTGVTDVLEGTAGAETKLTLAHTDALGSSDVTVQRHATLAVTQDTELTNDVELHASSSRVEAGNNILVTANFTGRIMGESKSITSTDRGGVIRDATFVNADITLRNAAGLSYTIDRVHLGVDSLVKSADSLTRSGTGSTLTMTDVNKDVNTADNHLTLPTDKQSIITNQNTQEDIYVYGVKLTEGSLTTTIEGTLTVNLMLTDAEYAEFTSYIDDDLVGFELLNGVTLGAGTWYNNVTFNINDASGNASQSWNALGQITQANGNIMFYIPEPSTATLSLLALAGLLARRRRTAAQAA